MTWLRLAKDYIREVAPENVTDTIGWLEANGWRAQEARGGGMHAFVITFEKDRYSIRIGTESRDPWVLEIRPPGWKYPADLGIIMDAASGRLDLAISRPEPASDQSPPGVDWIAALPRVLTWLNETKEARKAVQAYELKRSRVLFPPARRKRTRAAASTR